MGFVQVIEFRTSKIDEVRKTGDEWEAAVGSESTTPPEGAVPGPR